MARKGSRKVRTGCLTCKIRKIKCDEGKPFCNRCTSTGRKCDGYAVEPASVLRWQRPQTLQIDSSTSGEEARALQYYCEHVAPFIAGPTDPYFWTHLAVQFINREPAVKHSVIAIGLLHFVPEKSTLWDSSINGVDMGGNFKVRFFMRTPEDALYVHEEVLGCEYVPDLSPFEGQHESFSSSPQSIQGWEETTIF
ncbi:Aspercryptin biosynthesis cluster-specific transcription regulator atnN [Colletotrichum fructicola]|nr:Aspercryptin biosynthesis cluster-specific transcription regulator atnN [Colletotrichum fructicola]KAF5514999.1 Aspercryptin biosynthesis cluster-specific transcription regulator atnN [Colletotrichum fructicola]